VQGHPCGERTLLGKNVKKQSPQKTEKLIFKKIEKNNL
jgi:hypothetical protein